jgi:Tol biopolymer transport system component
MRTLGAAGLVILVSSTGWAQVTQRVSVASDGTQGDDSVEWLTALSADGRYVAFASWATQLVPGDTNGMLDVFVRDRALGTTSRVSVASDGTQGNLWSGYIGSAAISADGRYVAFDSFANQLVPGDTNLSADVFVHDQQLGTTILASLGSTGVQGTAPSFSPSISGDGRYVAFQSHATNLVPGDTNAAPDLFVRDLQLGTTERVSVGTGGSQANDSSLSPAISADGRYVAFYSAASDLVPGDTNGVFDVFVRDRQLGTTVRASLDTTGGQAEAASVGASISGDGRYVGFGSLSALLVPGDTNLTDDAFVRDLQAGTTERISVSSGGAEGNSFSGSAVLSAGGRYVTFDSQASNLVPGDTNSLMDVFVRDRLLGTTERVSVDSAGVQADGPAVSTSISSDGRYVAIAAEAQNLVPADTNGEKDAFVHDRLGVPAFTSQCDPGASGVIACPCSNPPSGPGRGCDNSSSTGGAILAASGGTYLSSDSLVFTTSGERPTALSIVAQSRGTNATGAVFGQGVLCTSGTIQRLYTKNAVGGSIRAPSFGAGDLQVSVRSVALGDAILAGQSRWYVVYYRDPVVLGGCAASSTLNATQTGEISWSP